MESSGGWLQAEPHERGHGPRPQGLPLPGRHPLQETPRASTRGTRPPPPITLARGGRAEGRRLWAQGARETAGPACLDRSPGHPRPAPRGLQPSLPSEQSGSKQRRTCSTRRDLRATSGGKRQGGPSPPGAGSPTPASHGRQRILSARYRPRPPVGGSCNLLWYRGLSGSTRSWMDAFTGPCRQGRPGEAAAEPSPDPAGEPCCPLPVARSPHVPTRPAAAGRISAQPGTRWIPSVVLLSPVSRPAFNSPHRTADSVKQSL